MRITRWQGTIKQIGFVAFAVPTARAAPGAPTLAASSPYETVVPAGTSRSSFHTLCLNCGALRRDRDRVERVDFAGEVRGEREVHADSSRGARLAASTNAAVRTAPSIDDRTKRADGGFYLGEFSCHANVLRPAGRTDPDNRADGPRVRIRLG